MGSLKNLISKLLKPKHKYYQGVPIREIKQYDNLYVIILPTRLQEYAYISPYVDAVIEFKSIHVEKVNLLSTPRNTKDIYHTITDISFKRKRLDDYMQDMLRVNSDGCVKNEHDCTFYFSLKTRRKKTKAVCFEGVNSNIIISTSKKILIEELNKNYNSTLKYLKEQYTTYYNYYNRVEYTERIKLLKQLYATHIISIKAL